MSVIIGRKPQAAAPAKQNSKPVPPTAAAGLDTAFDLPDDLVEVEGLDNSAESASFEELVALAESSVCAGFNSAAKNIVDELQKANYFCAESDLTRLFQIIAVLRNGAKQNKPLQVVGISKPNPTAYSFQAYSPAKTGSPIRIHYQLNDGTKKSASGSCFGYKLTEKGIPYFVFKENGDFSGILFDGSKGEGPLVLEKVEASAESELESGLEGELEQADSGEDTQGIEFYCGMLAMLENSSYNTGIMQVVYKALSDNIQNQDWDEKQLFQALSASLVKYSKANLK